MRSALASLFKSKPARALQEAADVRWLMWLYIVLLFLNALDAYNLGRVPFQWIMQLGSIGGAGYIALRHHLPKPLGIRILWLIFLWSGVVTVVSSLVNHYSSLMPAGATTPYVLFIALRLVTILSFIASLYLVYWLLQHGSREHLFRTTIFLGTLEALVAIYFYEAQLHGLPEPPRNRLGTGGGLQAVTFTYDFHRALGTFREPGLLAAWLIVPFFLAIDVRGKLTYLQGIIIVGTILLTGSLAGILALVLGLVAATCAAAIARVGLGGRLIPATLVVLGFALAIFYLLASSNTGHGVNLFETLSARLAPIFGFGRGQESIGGSIGLGQSDRGPIYAYVAHTIPPVLGVGLGNANLQLTHYLAAKVVASFISLYLNSLYSAGLVGLALLGWFLLTPALKVVTNPALRRNSRVLFLLAPYVAWLVIFGVAVEEFDFMSAVLFAILSYVILQDHPIAGPASGASPESRSRHGAVAEHPNQTLDAIIQAT